MMLNNDFIKFLYNKYKNELITIREKMKHNHHIGVPQFDDIEAELTVLLLLYNKPKNVIEFSPYTGWSTSIILDTLELNNNGAFLKSYDIVDRCSNFIKSLNHKNVEWNFELGDVSKKFKNWNLNNIDYLFIDSDHSLEFAILYINLLLIPLLKNCKKNKRKVIVSVHDIFHDNKPESNEEGEAIINFLSENNINYYSVAKSLNINFNIINNIRNSLSFNSPIHESQTNPSIFFILK
jgi:hypothetical protein